MLSSHEAAACPPSAVPSSFPYGAGSGYRGTATAKHRPNAVLCSCSNLTHPHRFQKTKEIPKKTNTKPREQPECGEMEVWGKKKIGKRLKPNISTPLLNQRSFTCTQWSDDTALLGQHFKNTIVEGLGFSIQSKVGLYYSWKGVCKEPG